MSREPDAVPAFLDEIQLAHGANKTLDAEIDTMRDALMQVPPESEARRLVERMALLLQASILVRHAPSYVADAFCATRLSDRPGFSYGALNAKIDTAAILARAMPSLG
jgi:putative acyl-CoA dehydrogenase